MISSIFSGLIDSIGALAVAALNAIIAGIGTLLAALLALLPEMPAIPSLPSEFTLVAGWVAWIFPVSTVVDALGFTFAAWLAFQAVAMGRRWVKGLS